MQRSFGKSLLRIIDFRLSFLAWALLVVSETYGVAVEQPRLDKPLTDEQVTAFARLAIENIEQEYPNKLSHVWTEEKLTISPRKLHPTFYGSFDWHSSVHGHWMLLRLLKLYPDVEICSEIRPLLEKQFTAEKLQREAEYFQNPSNRAYERMYGWAWALRLCQELRTWNDPQARFWSENFSVLENHLVESIHGYLPRLTYPVRTGVHPDTAFALSQILDYARAVDNDALAKLIVDYSLKQYTDDEDYPVNYEPSGQDFFSSGLNEADLMRRVMQREQFSRWLKRFLPDLEEEDSKASKIFRPAIVSDVSDPQIVHLAGLNLSRAWTQRGIASALSENDPHKSALDAAAAAHCDAGLQYIFSGHYEGEHWLATFAVYLLTDTGMDLQ